MIRVLALTVGLALGTPAAAFAHAHLVSAVPPVGGTVQTAPTDVAITFSEGVEPRFCTIAVTDGSGARVDAGPATTAGGDAKRLMVPLKPLAAGTYSVTWHAVAVDTHQTDGRFTFTVAKPSP